MEFEKNLMAAAPESTDDLGLEFGWTKLSRSLAQIETEETPLESNVQSLHEKESFFAGYWKIAAVALACLPIGQGVYISQSKTTSNYQLASETEESGTTMQIAFSSNVNLETVSMFLGDHKGQIISGPSKLGIYTLSFSDIENCHSATEAFNAKEQFVDTYTSCSTRP